MKDNAFQNNKKTITTNLIWRFLERFGAQIVSFVVSIILARLLDPVVYGTIALVTVFTTFLNVFVDSGFGTALIQKKNSDDLDFSTVFYFNIFACSVLYGAVFLLAPVISNFYNRAELTPIIRVLSIVLVISGVKSIQVSYVSKHMLFKKFFLSTSIGTVASAFVGIYMAYKGYGVWALVAQHLTNQAIDTIVLWISVKWKPKKAFSFKRLKTLFSFGWKLLVSKLIDTGYNEIRSLVIGKRYSSEDLAFYNKGKQFPELIITNINSSIDSVLFPAMSSVQDNKSRVKAMTRASISVSTYILFPLMVMLAMCAEPIVVLILTEKWLPCVFYLRIFCFSFAIYPIHTANLNAIKSMGRSDYFLKLEIIKKIIGIGILFSVMWISVEAIAWSLLATTIFSLIINSWPNKKLLNYSLIEQIKDMLPAIILSCIMGLMIYWVGRMNDSSFLTLIKQILVGLSTYIAGSLIIKSKTLLFILSIFGKKKDK